jgi:hypothetical protein
MKEPLVADFLERFLDLHNLSNKPTPVSRPTSVRSRQSSRSITTQQQNRLSFRLSQAELLDYSHQQQQQRLNASADNSPTTHSPRTSALPSASGSPSSLTPNSSHPSPNSRPSLPHRLSRGPSMTSLDAAMTSM